MVGGGADVLGAEAGGERVAVGAVRGVDYAGYGVGALI